MRERGLEQNIREPGRGCSFIYSLMNNKMRLTFKRINFLGSERREEKEGKNRRAAKTLDQET